MKIEKTSEGGIVLKIELDADERKNIKIDLADNLDNFYEKTSNRDTDRFLEEIKNLL